MLISVSQRGPIPQLLITTPSPLSNGMVGRAYSQGFTAIGGVPPYTWSLLSAAPNSGGWMSIAGANLVGTPDTVEGESILVRVQDSVGANVANSFTFTVDAALVITTVSLPNGSTGTVYSAPAMTAIGGVAPYSWSILTEGPGSWLACDSSGNLSGTPTTAEVESIQFQCVDALGRSATATYPLTVTTSSSSFDFYIANTGNDNNLGTQVSPWSINALNSKQATYAGKRVGFIAGTYVTATLYNAGAGSNAVFPDWTTYANANAAPFDGYTPLFNIKGGSSTSPTYFGAVSGPGTVVINCNNNGAKWPCTQPLASGYLNGGSSYTTWDGFVFDGLGGKGIMYGIYSASGAPTYFGAQILNCEFKNQVVTQCQSGVNLYGVELNSMNGALFQNSYWHNAVGGGSTRGGAKSGDHFNATYVWGSSGVTYDSCTVIDQNGFHAKENNNQGTLIKNCLIDCTGWTGAYWFQDGSGVTVSGITLSQTTIIRNSVMIGGSNGADMEAELGNGGWTTPMQFFNCTLIMNGTDEGVRAMCQSGSSRLFSLYNCIVQWAGGVPGYGNFSITINGAGLIDYNIYGGAKWASHGVGQYTSLGVTGYSSLASWQAAMAGSVGADAHSVVNNTPGFAGTGLGASKYKLTGGAVAANFGRIGGVVGGAACDNGAWGGASIPSTIGSSLGPQ